MTQTFTTNKQNDIFLNTRGNISVSSGIEGVLYACQTAAQAQLREMIYSYNNGVANFQTIWRNVANTAQFEASLRRALLNVENVTGVIDLKTAVADNAVSYSATIETTYGARALNG